ncbi:MAG TPA: AAA family ATPase, partial [Nocardioidaceae bacterium]
MVHGVVGREAELARLEGFLDRMVEGPTALVLEGEAGIGKTTLFDATTGAATARGYRVLAARAAQPEARLSFAAFTDLLDSVAPEVLPNLPDPQRRAVEIALLRLDPGGRPPDQRTVCAGFVSAIATLASDTPVLIAVDDVQWLDRPSARVLEFAARRLGDRRVGLLLSARASDRSELPFGLSRALPDRRVDRLRVGPVSLAVLHHVIRERLDVSFLRPQMLRIERASGGNPFFALELARDIAKRGT